MKLGAELIVLAIPSATPEMLGRLVVICESTGLPVTVMPSLADLIKRGFKDGAFPEAAWKLQSRAQEMGKEQTWN